MEIQKRIFTKDQSGTDVYCYRMINDNGMIVTVCEIGAAIYELIVPNQHGEQTDVVLGFGNLDWYFKNWPAFGAIVGRCANRIDKASFELNGKTYQLEKGFGGVTLHSGSKGYPLRTWESEVWEVEHEQDRNALQVKFHLFSPNGDQGFPGNLHVTVIYTLDNENGLTITYQAKSDADTILNLTNHSYFNLNGHGEGTIWEHLLQIDSDEICELDKRGVPTGKMLKVEGTAYDFKECRTIGAQRKKSFFDCFFDKDSVKEYDVNYKVNEQFGTYREVAKLEGDRTGIEMRVYTDMPGMQIYTAGVLGGHKMGKQEAVYEKYGAICMETQFFPNAIHIPEFVQPVLKKDDMFMSKTRYEFSSGD